MYAKSSPVHIALALAVVILAAAWPANAQASAGALPNVVVLMVDDMRADELGAMPKVNELLVSRGASFTRHYASHPLCCPSRVTLLTGQYAHNHGVFGIDREGAAQFMDGAKSGILPEWLQARGYRTGLVGKYLNEYGHERSDRESTPAGFDDWHALIDPPGTNKHPTYYRYRINDNGRTHAHGVKPADYLTTVLTGKAVRFIEESKGRKPMFLWASYYAPHNSPGVDPHNTPANYCARAPKPGPGDLRAFRDAALPQGPSFNADNSNKPAAVRSGPLSAVQIESIRRMRNCRLAALQAVDRGVERIVQALGSELANTLIVFVSDNGFMLGEHRIAKGKAFLYEESSRVPLVLSGPGVQHVGAVSDLVVNADIASTILDVPTTTGHAPIAATRTLDGISLIGLPAKKAHPRRAIVLETKQFRGIYNGRFKWARYRPRGGSPPEFEMYDLAADPFELSNIYDLSRQPSQAADDYTKEAKRMRALARKLRNCKGDACR